MNLSILRVCRGIYAELHNEMRSCMINDALQDTDLTVMNGRHTWNDGMRVWKWNGRTEKRFGLIFKDITRRFYFAESQSAYYKTYDDQIPSPEILGALLTFSVHLQLHRKYDIETLYKMLEEISKELTHVRQIRIPCRRAISWMTEEDRSCYWRALQIFITLPTVREICIDGQLFYNSQELQSLSFKGDLAVIQVLLTQNEIPYSDGVFRTPTQYIINVGAHNL
jgi:hypothetical protein